MKTKKYIMVKNQKYESIVDVEKQLGKKREYLIMTKSNKVFYRGLFSDDKTLHYVGEYIDQSNSLNDFTKENDLIEVSVGQATILRKLLIVGDGKKIEGLNDPFENINIVNIYRQRQKGKYIALL